MKQQLLNIAIAVAALAVTPHSITARELAQIESKGTLRVAVKDNLRPLGFTNEAGNLVGLEIDIARKLAEQLLGDKDAVQFLPVDNQERLQVVLDNEVDLAIARVSVTTPRARIVDFSPHYYLDGTSIVTNQPKITKVSDLKRSKIAVLKNSVTIAVIRNKLPNAVLIGVDSYHEALQLIETNQAEAFAGDRSILAGWVQQYPQYKILPARLSGAALAVVMPKGLQYKELHSKVNKAIAQWKQSGWLEERIKYWGL
ncbi:MAG: transporter substrate-binding domain-containing protein [Pleurocapsa sp.]